MADTLYLDPQMLLTVCLFKPRTWNHALDKTFHKLKQSNLMWAHCYSVTHSYDGICGQGPSLNNTAYFRTKIYYLHILFKILLCYRVPRQSLLCWKVGKSHTHDCRQQYLTLCEADLLVWTSVLTNLRSWKLEGRFFFSKLICVDNFC